MRTYGPQRIHTVGLFGHGGSGKTTLAESLLLTAKAILRAGRVEDGTTASDHDPDEQRRHASINLSVLPLEWEENKLNLIDVPGTIDFAAEIASAMRVIDAAVIVIDASGGVEVGTELAWEAAREAGVPVILFVNKLDRENADFLRTVEHARAVLDPAVVPMQLPIGDAATFRGMISLRKQRAWIHSGNSDGAFAEGDVPTELRDTEQAWRDQLVDKIAATNDDLIEKYLEGGADALTQDELNWGLRAGIANGSIVPVFCGSATQVSGMAQLLSALLDAVPSAARKVSVATSASSGRHMDLATDAGGPLAALVFKTLVDPYGKQSFVRVYSGELHANSTVYNPRTGKEERVGQLYLARGKELTAIHALGPGDVGVIAKLGDVRSGDTLCARETPLTLPSIAFADPVYTMKVKPRTRADLDKLGGALHHALEEDPGLHIERDGATGETLLSGQGEPHLQVVAERMRRKYGVEVDLELPRVPYRETIRGRAEAQYRHKKQTGGAGQFGDVTIRIEPLTPDAQRADPLEFVNAIVGGAIDRSFVPAVEKGVREAMAEGVLSGSQLVDVRVELCDGKMHPVDSKEIAFKIAGHEAFRLAVQKAQPVIMEPYVTLEIVVPDHSAGDIMSDMTGRRARVLGMLPDSHGHTTITACAPLAEVQRYATDLRAMTQGRGRFQMHLDHYEDVPAHLAGALIEQMRKEHHVGS